MGKKLIYLNSQKHVCTQRVLAHIHTQHCTQTVETAIT